ncbi:hypothetical protein B0T19DRAFT_194592 [Cercophora scortea]|uniref:Secreted protein n=1 Tax=Cercophora scortea TaxID=314031 RepID=A0AAE0ME99_9PEZI|nr:hypothetical protein B0T19DRAFT_194592 [Cercophora scortea]
MLVWRKNPGGMRVFSTRRHRRLPFLALALLLCWLAAWCADCTFSPAIFVCHLRATALLDGRAGQEGPSTGNPGNDGREPGRKAGASEGSPGSINVEQNTNGPSDDDDGHCCFLFIFIRRISTLNPS